MSISFEEEDFDYDAQDIERLNAQEVLREFFKQNSTKVFYTRQLQILHEHQFFHWITGSTLKVLVEQKEIRTEKHNLSNKSTINLYWHKSFRYYKRDIKRVIGLVNEYTHFSFTNSLGLHGERMVLHAFALAGFNVKGESTREFNGKIWTNTEHDLDYIFEKDLVVYGVEVKNTLDYIDDKQLKIKIKLCDFLGIKPVFVVRMMPKTWIYELIESGGYAMIIKYQLYPWAQNTMAKKIREELQLPVDTPTALAKGTIDKFVKWHQQNL